MAQSDAFAWLGGIDVGLADSEMIAAGGGEFFIAGGVSPNDSNTTRVADGNLYEMDIPESDAAPVFSQVGTLPVWTDDDGAGETTRVGANFLRITEPGTGDEYGFLLGGGNSSIDGTGSSSSTYSANLYNLATGVWDENPIVASDQLQHPREYAAAAVDVRGQVVVVGGWDGQDDQWAVVDTVEVYVPNERKFYSVGTVPSGAGTFGIGIATVGDDGTLYCGGGQLASSTSWTVSGVCGRVATSRSSSKDSEMPTPVADPGMLTLSDGRVLAVGGGSGAGEVEVGSYVEGSTSVQEYDPLDHSWTEHPLVLKNPRVGGRAVELPDGSVLVFGGAEKYDPIYGYKNPMPCAELLNPDTFVSTALSACTSDNDTGDLPEATAGPMYAVDEEYGVVVAGGRSNVGGHNGTPSSAASLYLYPRAP